MKLTIINGSPRGKSSNTKILVEHFITGFIPFDGEVQDIIYLKTEKNEDRLKQVFLEAQNLIVAFPLYTDAMPAIVKAYIEVLVPLCQAETNKPNLGFIVQSGFPEAKHTTFIEPYLKKLSHRLGCHYIGTIIKGGVEGIKMQPLWMTKKYREKFEQLGTHFAKTGEFNADIVKKLAKPYMLPAVMRIGMRVMKFLGLMDGYWNNLLKENDAYQKRYATPYTKN